MRETSRGIMMLVLLSAAGCSPADKISADQQKVNIEVTGTPECLAQVIKPMADRGIGVPVLPKWSGGIGSMEIGPVENQRYDQTVEALKALTCIKSVRRRPCATPNSDLKVC